MNDPLLDSTLLKTPPSISFHQSIDQLPEASNLKNHRNSGMNGQGPQLPPFESNDMDSELKLAW